LVGGGVGIISTELSYYLAGLIFKDKKKLISPLIL